MFVLKATMGELARKLADPNSGLCAELAKFYEHRLPPGQRPSSFTLQQLVTALEDQAFAKKTEALVADLDHAMGETSDKRGMWQKVKDKMMGQEGGLKKLFQAAIHGIAIAFTALALAQGGDKIHAIQIVQCSLTLAAEGLALVGMGVRSLMTWGIGRVKGWSRMISFFFNATTEAVASVGRR